MNFFQFKEHGYQINSSHLKLSDIVNRNKNLQNDISSEYQKGSLKYLGLEFDNNPIEIKANYYIGLRWFEWNEDNITHKDVIQVFPKRIIDFNNMLVTCLNNPIVANHMENSYEIFTEEPFIQIEKSSYDLITPFVIIDYLYKIRDIVHKGLKKDFIVITRNLTGKIKGKINVSKTINRNILQPNKTYCSYHIYSIDCLENRILKAGLLIASKYLIQYSSKQQLFDLLNFVKSAFQLVSKQEISPKDFLKVKESSFYKEYSPALKLARILLSRFGWKINFDISYQKQFIPPFYINMPELFERYCEVKLRETVSNANLMVGYDQHNPSSRTEVKTPELRPDFLLPKQNMIIDSKYKYWIAGNDIESLDYKITKILINKDDLQQISLYSRHRKILKKLNNNAIPPKLVFIFPHVQGHKTIDFSFVNREVGNLYEIYCYPLTVPQD
jgi:5-methylcytosine-specific restriction endonuclease McrBC regulatory subunit McrC